MRKKIRLKNMYYSGTRVDHIVGGHPPKRRPPRPDSWVFIVRAREEPPETEGAAPGSTGS